MYEFMEDNPSSNEDFVHTKSLLYRIIASSKIIKTDILQNYPNPFNSETWIPYQLAEGAEVNLSIYDSTGRLVRIIDLGYRPVGAYLVKEQAIYWDGKANSRESVASGVYFYCIKAGKFTAARKMLILR